MHIVSKNTIFYINKYITALTGVVFFATALIIHYNNSKELAHVTQSSQRKQNAVLNNGRIICFLQVCTLRLDICRYTEGVHKSHGVEMLLYFPTELHTFFYITPGTYEIEVGRKQKKSKPLARFLIDKAESAIRYDEIIAAIHCLSNLLQGQKHLQPMIFIFWSFANLCLLQKRLLSSN